MTGISQRREALWRVLSRRGPMGRLHTAAFLAAVFFCIFIPLRNTVNVTWIKAVPDAMIAGLLIWYVIAVRFRLRLRLQDWLFLAFLGVGAAASLTLGHSTPVAVVFQLRSVGVYYAFYFVARELDMGRDEHCLLTDVLQGMGLILAVFGVVEKITHKTVLFPRWAAEKILYASNFERVYGLFCNPNTYALFLVLVIFLSLFRRLRYGVKTPVWIYGVLLACLLLTVSRSGMLVLVVGGVLIALYARRTLGKAFPLGRAAASLLLSGAMAAVCFAGVQQGANLYYNRMILASDTSQSGQTDPSESAEPVTPPTNQAGQPEDPDVIDRMGQILSPEEWENSQADGRIFSIKTGLRIFKDHPLFGAGFGTFGSAATQSYPSPIAQDYGFAAGFYADNEYIKIIAENGAVGVLLFAAFFLTLMWQYRRDALKLLLLISVAMFGVFYNIFEVQIGAMILWLFLSIRTPEKEVDREQVH